VSYWQAMQVSTASANRMSVSVLHYDTFSLEVNSDGEPRIPAEPQASIAVSSGCYGDGRSLQFDWPGPGRTTRVDPPRGLCSFTSMTGLLQNGGFPILLSVTAEDGSVASQSEWVSVDRSDILCRRDCTQQFLAAFGLPDINWEPDDSGGGPLSVERSAIPPVVYRAGRLSLLVEFDIGESGVGQDWFFGEPMSFDTSDRIVDPLPTLTLVAETTPATEMDPYRVGEYSYATARSFRVESAEPVSLEVEVLGFGHRSGKAPCTLPGQPTPSYENAALASVHTFQLSGLCLGDNYHLRIGAVDTAGFPHFVRVPRSLSDRLDAALFYLSTGKGTLAYSYDVVAELQLGTQPVIPPLGALAGPFLTWVYLIGDLEVPNGIWRDTAAPPDQASVPFANGWRYSNLPGKTIFCNEQPYNRRQPSPLGFRLRDVEARENDNPILQTLRLKLHDYPDSFCGGPAPLVRSFDTDLSLSGNPSLTQLVEGVAITDGVANYPRLVVRAENIQWTRIGWTSR